VLLQKNRLTKDSDIKKVFAKSKRLSSKEFLFYVHKRSETESNPARLAIVISAKTSKKATIRNKARRILSEIIRVKIKERANFLDSKDVVLTVKDVSFLDLPKIELANFLKNDFGKLLDEADVI
jgi:ribonuclease P protein component